MSLSCPCGRPADAQCSECGRVLCAWHYALRPALKKKTVRVCHPECGAAWWKTPYLEARSA